PDLRNTRVIDLIAELQDYGMQVDVHDPWANPEDARQEYGLELTQKPQLGSYDAIVLAVAHRQYREMGAGAIRAWLQEDGVLYDVKHLLPLETVEDRL
ncbi:Vi polysaccharide biosynthesis UDP-N-acetylglucosamine C-6 dehydrogenase TviB, partial [Tepidiphilus sp. B18-69]|nr:Vi polysaccharide biosynthesis UDP-N-acetylglucosamine C-6 dehydrogenase TviB [Tepidiphilus baoligensis]